jgi:hypothetical protein
LVCSWVFIFEVVFVKIESVSYFKIYDNTRRRMKLKHHITASIIISAFLFTISKSWIIFTSSLISGVLIDIDHVLDYFWDYGINLRIKKFFEVMYSKKISRLWLIFHSWELLFLLIICAFLMSWNPWIVGTIIGFTHHLISDQIFYKLNKWSYFFFWRMKNSFSVELFPKL